MAHSVIGYGIIVDDIVHPDGETRMGVLGGAGPQTAWGAALALGDGSRTGLVAGVGEDIATVDLSPLTAAGINLDGVRRTEHPTPRAWQVLEWDGLRRHVWRCPVEILDEQLARGWDVLPASYQNAAFFHWGIDPGNTALDREWAAAIIANGGRVSLEPYQGLPQPLSPETLRELVGPLVMFSANDHEARSITGENTEAAIVRAFRKTGCHYLAIRQGADGALVVDLHSGEGVRVPAVPAAVVDVVGAGNTFNGALLATLHHGIAEAACYASAAASYMIEQVGMPIGLPPRDDYLSRVETARTGRETLNYD